MVFAIGCWPLLLLLPPTAARNAFSVGALGGPPLGGSGVTNIEEDDCCRCSVFLGTLLGNLPLPPPTGYVVAKCPPALALAELAPPPAFRLGSFIVVAICCVVDAYVDGSQRF